MTFEDLAWLYDTTFFPETDRRFGHLVSGGKPYLMEGLVEEEFCTVTLTVNKLWVPPLSPCFDSSIHTEQGSIFPLKPV